VVSVSGPMFLSVFFSVYTLMWSSRPTLPKHCQLLRSPLSWTRMLHGKPRQPPNFCQLACLMASPTATRRIASRAVVAAVNNRSIFVILGLFGPNLPIFNNSHASWQGRTYTMRPCAPCVLVRPHIVAASVARARECGLCFDPV